MNERQYAPRPPAPFRRCLWVLVGAAWGLRAAWADGAALPRDLDALLGDGPDVEPSAALARLMSDPDQKPRLLTAWASARDARRYRLLVPLAVLLSADETAGLLLEEGPGRLPDEVDRVILATALADKARQRQPAKGKQTADAGWSAFQRRALLVTERLSTDPDWRVRLRASELLLTLDSQEPGPCLRRLMADGVWPVRQDAIEALGAMPPGENLRILDGLLSQKDEGHVFERVAAVKAMARLGHVPGLLAGLDDADREVQWQSLRGLSALAALPDEAVGALRRRLETEENGKMKQEIQGLLDRQGRSQ